MSLHDTTIQEGKVSLPGQYTVPSNRFNEMMGYPGNQLVSQYWFPWYDSVNMPNSIMISRP